MMKYILLFLFSGLISNSIAQTQFLDSTFLEVDKTTYNFYTDNQVSLALDFYRARDAKGSLPLLIYVHGGGFVSGKRDSDDIITFARQLAQRGYAVASVSYRLTMKGIGFGCNVPANQKVGAINAASQDVGLAIQYMLDNNKDFQVMPDKITLAGSSAGAETVLNMAYVYDNTALPDDFQFAGVIAMAGAITTLDKIDLSATPAQFFHGTGDILVPYGIGPHHYCNSNEVGLLTLYGSYPIAQRLKGIGISYYLYTINNGSHDWAGLPMSQCLEEIVDFLYFDVFNKNGVRQTERVIVE